MDRADRSSAPPPSQAVDFALRPATLELPLPVEDVLDLFLAQVRADPLAIAVASEALSLDYGQLDRRSNQLAQALVANGARPGAIVAIRLARPIDRIVAILGCLKAGCVFAPVDPGLPAARQRQLLETAAPPWRLEDDGEAAGPCLWAEGAASPHTIAGHAESAIRIPRDPDAGCYLYFTSGSSGRPKAVLGRIRGLAHFIQWEIQALALGPGTRVSQLTGPGFDVSLRDLFVPLCCGGIACVPPAGLVRDPTALARWLDEERIALVHCVPSLFRRLLSAEWAPAFAAMRYVLLAGESLPPADANRWIERYGERVRLLNLYGPTETTLAKFVHRLPATPVQADFVPIGRPIPGTQAMLLDDRLEPVARGEIGELVIRTPYRSLGYLDPADGAQRFIVNPFTGLEGDLVYRTGDLARQLDDGSYRFCGRRDFQLKIGGVRIEPAEVEARMLECDGVREAVVVARPDASGEPMLVGYFVATPAGDRLAPITPASLRAQLAQALPEALVPSVLVALEALPLTANGKLDRAALPAPGRQRPDLPEPYQSPCGGLEMALCQAWARVLGLERVGRLDNFFELGGNSLRVLGLLESLRATLGRTIAPPLVFSYPTPASLAAVLDDPEGASAIVQARLTAGHRQAALSLGPALAPEAAPGSRRRHEPIAIIGMAGRFPGAQDVDQFWDNLCAGRESITRFAADELDASLGSERREPGYVAARGVIDGVEQFDAGFFGIAPREAELMDPQHRIFLELCWECMERAGEVPDAASAPVGVFAGTYHSTYLRRHVEAHPDKIAQVGRYQVVLANEKDYLATRVANKLNLTGPAISLYTACSTSLVAVCQALDSLRAGRCDMALAGGVAITCPPRSGYLHQEGAMFSPDGHTRSFDAKAGGTVFSDGAGVVLLKRLSDAQRDGNPVIALLLGASINNDGSEKASFTAPNADAQAAVIAMAQADAGVSARSIGYVEAHGTATPMGDPIEVQALTRAFRAQTHEVGFCRLGSVKSNVGHLVIAAGAAGLIKAAMGLSRRQLPATLHFETANPALELEGSPFVVNDRLMDWQGDAPLRAGVSSFGVGGTNAHVVLEQPPAAPESETQAGPQLLVLSARTPQALQQAATRLADALAGPMPATESRPELADVAWTLARGRKAFAHRACLVAADLDEAVAQLRAPELADAIARGEPAQRRQPVFLFPGQGAQYPRMGRALIESEPVFRMAFDACHEILADGAGLNLHGLLASEDPRTLLPTAVMQPATFAIEYALARLWISRGAHPAAMIGHSVGEFVAATVAGVFDLADALRLVARRGALMQAQAPGAMLGVRLSWADLRLRLPPWLSLAAENAPGNCVVAGEPEAIADFARRLDADGIASRLLATSHAFHSWMMDPAVAPFRAEVEACRRGSASIPIVSSTTGHWLDPATAASPDYWARHLREPVRFSLALAQVLDAPGRVLLEAGPRGGLCALARQHPLARETQAATVTSLGSQVSDECTALRSAAGRLWCLGVPVDPAGFDQRRRRRRLLLPTYPFQRQRHWVDAASTPARTTQTMDEGPQAAPRDAGAGHREADVAGAAKPGEVATAGSTRARLMELLGAVTGLPLAGGDENRSFIELGYDSLMLTQVSTQLFKTFGARIAFRELMGDSGSVNRLVARLDALQGAATHPVATVAPAGAALAGAAASRLPVERTRPSVPGARLGREPDGTPAWFIPHPEQPGKFLRIGP